MEIVIFSELTTEEKIKSIEENSKKYHDGLYVDMNNAPERKYVKESAEEINNILKALKALRIRKTKEFTATINKEHDAIAERLRIANLPLTTLIDEHKAERKKLLDAQKAQAKAIEEAAQKENDHEMALLINKTYEFDREEKLRLEAKLKEEIAEQARIEERARFIQEQERDKQRKINAENARLANIEHVKGVNNNILGSLVSVGLDETIAKTIVTMMAKNKIPNVTINY